jgi:ribosomal protein S12 methylthiotransferase
MPLQHISDAVLKGMKRGTRGSAIRKRVAEIREAIPNICMRTTMLVGYPGETAEDFEELIGFIKEAQFERLGAFAYSHEEGTPSYDLEGQLDADTKASRLDRLMYEQRSIAKTHNEAMIGREVEVLVEKRSDESELVWIGRTQFQAPEIDGITYLGSADNIEVGQIVRAVVTQSTDYDLVAKPI